MKSTKSILKSLLNFDIVCPVTLVLSALIGASWYFSKGPKPFWTIIVLIVFVLINIQLAFIETCRESRKSGTKKYDQFYKDMGDSFLFGLVLVAVGVIIGIIFTGIGAGLVKLFKKAELSILQIGIYTAIAGAIFAFFRLQLTIARKYFGKENVKLSLLPDRSKNYTEPEFPL
ncbi:MAG: hypothetical protein KKF46_00445 [Nanoarchaeota archaeon]|nr:hypothetical protein [Nanoarchaeota archaeon]MBU1320803.1 hypothetical protein [Nanoarchaeota archaeon]MBU2440882.1 hypothetical protein [Nanoarchaeota archaeon]